MIGNKIVAISASSLREAGAVVENCGELAVTVLLCEVVLVIVESKLMR